MRKSIALKAFRGRLGNQLFQVHNVLQLAKEFNFKIVLPPHTLREISPAVPKGSYYRSFFALACNHENISETLKRVEPYKLVNEKMFKRSFLRKGIILDSSVFSETFFALQFEKPTLLFPLASSKEDYSITEQEIAIHFRGTDFQNWNLNAVMKPKFYFDALDFFCAWKSKITLFTDDPAHEVVQILIRNLPKLDLDQSETPTEAFLRMAQFKRMIVSPSTFAIWAAMLGNNSSIVINSVWIHEMTNVNDTFWPGVALNRNNLFHAVTVI